MSGAEYRARDRVHQAECFESVAELGRGAAHAFNNLLGVIVSYTSFAVDELGDGHADVRNDLEQVRRAAESGSDLARRLALLGGREPVEDPIDVNPVIAQVADRLRRMMGDHIGLETNLSPDALRMRMGAGAVEEILVDLVTNALEAMPGGGPLTIETRPIALDRPDDREELPPGRYALLIVTDRGSGMPKETAERAFEPFFTTKSGEPGRGLGLATVYGIVGRAGGRITVDSEPGRGTRVEVELPLVTEEATERGKR